MKLFSIIIIAIAIILLIIPACDDDTTPTPVTIQPTPSQSNEPVALVLEHTGEPYSETFMDGLSGRTSLTGGMIFDFKDTVTVGFQMRETLIPLSIAFVSEDHIIMDIQDMEPLSPDVYLPASPYRYAIEVNQGYFEEHKIVVGDRIEFQESEDTGFMTAVFSK